LDDLISLLLNYAFNNNIGFELTYKLHGDTPSMAITNGRMIIINMNWFNKNEIPFIIAHEIAHVLNGDVKNNYKNKCNSVTATAENKANLRAVDIIIPMYFELNGDYSYRSITPIMEQLCIPQCYYNEVAKLSAQKIWYA
jgi:Zn-dependent peptidase ImmA (M78 family)